MRMTEDEDEDEDARDLKGKEEHIISRLMDGDENRVHSLGRKAICVNTEKPQIEENLVLHFLVKNLRF